MRKGYVYKITNNINGKIYVGQTARDIHTRFMEHCTSKSGTSALHNAIKKYNWRNFSVEQLEEVPLDQLDERERFWISELKSREKDIGYNISPGGQVNIFQPHNCVKVVENDLIFDSKEEMSRQVESLTNWSSHFVKLKINEAINQSDKTFLGYHLLSIPYTAAQSDSDTLEDWIKTLSIRYCGKHVHCIELDKDFDTIAAAASYLLENKLYATSSKTPIQALVTAIGKNIHGKTEHICGINQLLHFEEVPGAGTKMENNNNSQFSKTKVYCPQLDKTFDSQIEAANYFIDNKIWTGIKLKTAKLRISDIVRGYFPDYRGYTFQRTE